MSKLTFRCPIQAGERQVRGGEANFPDFSCGSHDFGQSRPGFGPIRQIPDRRHRRLAPAGDQTPEKRSKRGKSRHVALQLPDRQSQNAEHRMRENLRMTPDADVATAKIVLKPRVDTLNGGPVPVPDRLRVRDVHRRPRLRLHLLHLRQRPVAARIDVNDRNVAALLAVPAYLRRVMGGIHQLVEPGHARPSVIVASGMAARLSCRKAEVGMQPDGTPPSAAASMCGLQPVQDCQRPFAFRLAPAARPLGRSSIISSRLMPCWRPSRRAGLSTTSPLRGRPRKGGLARYRRTTGPPAQPTQGWIGVQTVNRMPRGRQVPDRLRQERPRKGGPGFPRTPRLPRFRRKKRLRRGEFKHGRKPLVALGEQTGKFRQGAGNNSP